MFLCVRRQCKCFRDGIEMLKIRFLKIYCLNVRVLFRFPGHSFAKKCSFMSVLSAKVMNNQISYFSKIFGTLHLNHGGKKKKT